MLFNLGERDTNTIGDLGQQLDRTFPLIPGPAPAGRRGRICTRRVRTIAGGRLLLACSTPLSINTTPLLLITSCSPLPWGEGLGAREGRSAAGGLRAIGNWKTLILPGSSRHPHAHARGESLASGVIFSPWLRQGVGCHSGRRRPASCYPPAEPGAALGNSRRYGGRDVAL